MSASLHGVLVVDKARGPTSHDVVSVARRALRTKEVGHTGTLDPMATGVLVLVIGEATKLVNSLTASEKRYEATLRLGIQTRTLDAEGEVEASAPVPALTRAEVESAARGFLGELDQVPPMVSAIKVDGQSLYKAARKGRTLEVPARRVRLDELTVREVRADEIELDLRCGSGFYVRALGRDLAAKLGTLGHLSALRRTQNGAFALSHAVSFDELRAARDDEERRAALLARVVPLAEVCRRLPHVELDDEGAVHARCGRRIPREHASGVSGEGTMVAFDRAGVPVALVTAEPTFLRVSRGFRAL